MTGTILNYRLSHGNSHARESTPSRSCYRARTRRKRKQLHVLEKYTSKGTRIEERPSNFPRLTGQNNLPVANPQSTKSPKSVAQCYCPSISFIVCTISCKRHATRISRSNISKPRKPNHRKHQTRKLNAAAASNLN